ncbi:MAG: DUF357 domain-containing protein [Halobacteriaceae archaeon]
MTDAPTKADQYEQLLATALTEADIVAPPETPLGEAAATFMELAESYLADGRHFRESEDPVNAVAAFSYGHAWLDAGARLGLFEVPTEGSLFTV